MQDREVEAEEKATTTKTRLTDKIKDLEERINDYQNREDILLRDKEKLCKLYELGVIHSEGKYFEDRD